MDYQQRELRWDENLSLQEIADINHVSYGVCASHRRKYNLKCVLFKKRRQNTKFKLKVINFLYKEGFTYEAIARLFNCDHVSIYNMRKNYF